MRSFINAVTEATAYHGTNADFDEFSLDHVGSGSGLQTFGWGVYLSSLKAVASTYRKRGTGRVLEVEMPPPDDLMLWDERLSVQHNTSKALSDHGYPEIRQKMIDAEKISFSSTNWLSNTGEDVYVTLCEYFISMERGDTDRHIYKKKASLWLLKAGVQGIIYTVIPGDWAGIQNYVIFDPRRVKIVNILK
jgi:hypothetical protein